MSHNNLADSSGYAGLRMEHLLRQLHHDDARFRQQALNALRNQRHLTVEMRGRISERLKDVSASVRQAAVQTLRGQSRLADDVLQEIVALLADDDTRVRTEAAFLLQGRKDLMTETLRSIVVCLDDPRADVRMAAAKAIGGNRNLTQDTLRDVTIRLNAKPSWVQEETVAALYHHEAFNHASTSQGAFDVKEHEFLLHRFLDTLEFRLTHWMSTTRFGKYILRLLRPSLQEGFERTEWECACGILMYEDYREHEILLAAASPDACQSASGSAVPPSDADYRLSGQTGQDIPGVEKAFPQSRSKIRSPDFDDIQRDITSVIRRKAPPRSPARFLEVCVNTTFEVLTSKSAIRTCIVSFDDQEESILCASRPTSFSAGSDRWRDFGLMSVYVGFNVFGAIFLYWFFRVRKASGKSGPGFNGKMAGVAESIRNIYKSRARVNKRNAEVF
ncbi:Multidrug resistance protein [Recurvomyces mirabilis]|nr:Multidrug resistance protein [Recurvomyces mirabilis]